jgi:hypothetical protein
MGTTPGLTARWACALAAALPLLLTAGTARADEMPAPAPTPAPPVGPIQAQLDTEFDQIIDEAEEGQLDAQIADAADGLIPLPEAPVIAIPQMPEACQAPTDIMPIVVFGGCPAGTQTGDPNVGTIPDVAIPYPIGHPSP